MKQNMIYLVLLSFFLSPFSFLLADTSITRGPAIGEIYYIGPTVTGEGIYHSTDFGETAICMDSTLSTNILFQSIAADLTPGVLYGYSMPENLYISYNYGQEGSWQFKASNISYRLNSGRNEGYLYNGKAKHSEDYGNTFIYHTCNGYFGDQEASEIDVQENIGYTLVSEYGVYDSLWFLISFDDFENFEIQYTFQFCTPLAMLSRGHEEGEIYLYTYYWGVGDGRKLRYSNDYGQTWELKNTFSCPNLPITGIVGGRQPGELYMNVEYKQLMCTIQHTYIYHSLDYGESFEVFHVFSCGDEPFYANFTATPLEGTTPLTVQFTDLSSGENLNYWEWDFQNDGVIDSYEQNPQYTYQDTGYYSVSLTIQYSPGEDTVARTNYIHVTSENGIGDEALPVADYKLSNYPNPFNPSTTISFETTNLHESSQIEIYNLKGQKIKTLPVSPSQSHTVSVTWNGDDQTGNPVSSGIYFARLKTGNPKASCKMLLLK